LDIVRTLSRKRPVTSIVNQQSSIHPPVIHIAVLLPQYIDLILAGEKTVECRLTKQARDPFENVEPGERIYFKASAGPYAATAIVEHVLCEQGLTPRRISEIKRDYNHLIRGEDQFWRWKRDSRYCTLVWLKDVQPTSAGPRVRPLQGVAWLCLDEEPAWRRVDAHDDGKLFPAEAKPHAAGNGAFSIEVTDGNLKNNTLYVTKALEHFPSWAIGGRNKREAAKRGLTLILHEGPTVQTDIVGQRKLLRTRVWGPWFRRHGVKPRDRVIFTPMDEATYFVGLTRPKAGQA
jgi:ASC-1-like (ASCH) protein